MAKISSCFQLCPLIDQKSFLGVSDDCDSGHVIVTLGKKIVIRYRLSDQKQVNSWTTNVRLSSPVVFDRISQKYVGVFNSNMIQMWDKSDVGFSSVKKYKFKESIHCILTASGPYAGGESRPLVIVFTDGRIAPLTTETLENRRDMASVCKGMRSVIEPIANNNGRKAKTIGSTIKDAHMLVLNNSVVVVLVTENSSSVTPTCHLVPLQADLFQPVSFSLLPKPDGSSLIGFVFIGGDTLKMFSLWSDNSLHCLELYFSKLQDISRLYPGDEVMRLKLVNTNHKVAILPLDNVGRNIAVYCCDLNEEGALLTIVNIHHKLVQCKYNFKLFCVSPKLWAGSPTDLLLVVGRHLAIAHYRLTEQKLASLVGTQQKDTVSVNGLTPSVWSSNDDAQPKVDYQNLRKLYKASASKDASSNVDFDFSFEDFKINENRIKHLDSVISPLIKQGLSESRVFDKAVCVLIESSSTEELAWLFGSYDDIPLDCLLLGINYCLDTSSTIQESGDVKPLSIMKTQQDKKNALLRIILQKSLLIDSKALSLLRQEIAFSKIIQLVNRVVNFMVEYPNDIKLINWATFILDSFYQPIMISKTEETIAAIKYLSENIENQLTYLMTWQEIGPLIKMVKTGRGINRFSQPSDVLYQLDSINMSW